MASREELRIIREARAGSASAQLALGRRYLLGEGTCVKNAATALYWLDRAARLGEKEAWMAIGSHIALDTVLSAANPVHLIRWYELAYDEGVPQAGLVFASLVLDLGEGYVDKAMRDKARGALEKAASEGVPEAQRRLTHYVEAAEPVVPTGAAITHDTLPAQGPPCAAQYYHAADNSLLPTQRVRAELAGTTRDTSTYLYRSLPMARAIARYHVLHRPARLPLSEADAALLSRCAHQLSQSDNFDPREVEQLWILAAQAGDKDAQFLLGLWFAKRNASGDKVAGMPVTGNEREAVRWLAAAAAQGVRDAWYVLAKVCRKKEAGLGHSLDPEQCLENAAEAGHPGAQLELAKKAWDAGGDGKADAEHAAYWLRKAVAQGSVEAQALFDNIAAHATAAPWAEIALSRLGAGISPLLGARLELAAVFGLTQTEALLLDLNAADCRHCLLVDIQVQYYRRKRRLILISTAEQRELLTRIVRLFKDVNCGPDGPEGSYRERLSRFKAALSAAKQQAVRRILCPE